MLSRGGRLVLVKSVLESIMVYWNSIVVIPKGVLDKIQRVCSRFLWFGHKEIGGFHLASWRSIADPKEARGWGLKDVRSFSKALAGRNLWRMTQGSSLWTQIMNSKYFPSLSVVDWFCSPLKSPKGSIVWKALVESFPLVGNWMAWRIGNGKNVRIGVDPWLGVGERFRLSPQLLNFLHDNDIHTLYDACIGFPQPRG
jgi:hypothetical protein